MRANELQLEVGKQPVDFDVLVDRVTRERGALPEVFAGLGAEEARVKYGCLKVLRMVSEKEPAVLYPEFDRIVELLESDSTFIKWGAIIIIGNLAAVDWRNKIEHILERFLRPISGPVMITAANIIGAAGKIAEAKPQLAQTVLHALLKVEKARYKTAECRNVALGHVIRALDQFFGHVKEPKLALAFVERQLRNRRQAVRRRAAAFLKKHGREFGRPAGRRRFGASHVRGIA